MARARRIAMIATPSSPVPVRKIRSAMPPVPPPEARRERAVEVIGWSGPQRSCWSSDLLPWNGEAGRSGIPSGPAAEDRVQLHRPDGLAAGRHRVELVDGLLADGVRKARVAKATGGGLTFGESPLEVGEQCLSLVRVRLLLVDEEVGVGRDRIGGIA